MALSYLYALRGLELKPSERSLFDHLDEAEVETVMQMLDRGYHTPLASSMGRLFDAVSSLLGLCQHNTFEGEAAVCLQLAAERCSEEHSAYPWSISRENGTLIADPRPLIEDILQDIFRGEPVPQIARRFHRAIAELVSLCCERIRDATGLAKVALSGGVFQNKLLTEMTVDLLRRDGFDPLVHRQVPPNDGGIALGQAAIAGHRNRKFLAGS